MIESYLGETKRLAGEEYEGAVNAYRGLAVAEGVGELLAHNQRLEVGKAASNAFTRVWDTASSLVNAGLDSEEVQRRLRQPEQTEEQDKSFQGAVRASVNLLQALQKRTSIAEPFWQREILVGAMATALNEQFPGYGALGE